MTLSKNPDRDELRAHFEESDEAPTECWENYGDVNPAPHGGDWVTYDPERGEFELIGTFAAADVGTPPHLEVPEDSVRHQWVYENWADFGDIVQENGEFTDAAASTASILHGCPDTPAGLIVDGRFTWFVVAFLDERRYSYGRGDGLFEGDYGDVLERVGVEPCEGEL